MTSVEKLATIKELITNLLYLGVGVFALVGGFLSQATHIKAPKTLLWSLAFFGLSLLAGFFASMRLVNLVVVNRFDPEDEMLRWLSSGQVILVILGSVIFFAYLLISIKHP